MAWLYNVRREKLKSQLYSLSLHCEIIKAIFPTCALYIYRRLQVQGCLSSLCTCVRKRKRVDKQIFERGGEGHRLVFLFLAFFIYFFLFFFPLEWIGFFFPFLVGVSKLNETKECQRGAEEVTHFYTASGHLDTYVFMRWWGAYRQTERQISRDRERGEQQLQEPAKEMM